MSIVDKEKIDSLGLSKDTGEVILTISDHLDWHEANTHLYALQEKLNGYISFIESDEIYQVYPEALGRKLTIQIVSKYDYPDVGHEFLSKVSTVINSLGVTLKQKKLED